MQNENSNKQQNPNRPRKDDGEQSKRPGVIPEKKFPVERPQVHAQNPGNPQPAQGQKPQGQSRDQATRRPEQNHGSDASDKAEQRESSGGHETNDDRSMGRDRGQSSARPGSNQDQREKMGAERKPGQR